MGCGSPLPLAMTPLLFPRDSGQAFFSCAPFSLQLLQLCGPFQGWLLWVPAKMALPAQPSSSWSSAMADPRGRFTGPRKQLGVSLGEGWHSASRAWLFGRSQGEQLLHGWNPAGYQADISEFAESHMGLGSGSGSFSGGKILFGFICAHCPWGHLGRIRRNCF